MRGSRRHRANLTKRLLCALALAVAVGGLAGCEKTTHENLDKWLNTQKGPGKLEDAFKDSDLSASLRGHAAQNLIRINKDQKVYAELEKMDASVRDPILREMATRLWEDARITGKMAKPTPGQAAAKDALWRIRKFASGATLAQIDKYLNEWLTGGYYEGRAGFGTVRGEIIVRALGSQAAAGLIDAANAIIAAPKDKEGRRLRFEKNLLVGLAATGDPKAVGKVLDAIEARETLGDRTLQKRGFFALHRAFVAPEGHPPADPKGLVPHIPRLMKVVRDPETELEIIDAVLPLVQAAGMPHCLDPLLGLIGDPPQAAARLRWIGVQRALLCGKLEGVKKVVEAFPTRGKYTKGRLEGSLWGYILEMKPHEKVASTARELLTSRSWVARLTGVEVLGRLRYAPTASKDAAAIAELKNDKTLLRGWWGEEKGKKTPRLGARAAAASQRLQELAKAPTK